MKMARKKAVKKYTLAEFKAWLEGVEEIQPNDWHPDLDQWRMIREKIGGIVVPPPPPIIRQPAEPTSQHVPVRPAMIPRPGQMVDPSVLPVTGDTPPSGAGGAPDMTPAAKAALSGKLPNEIATDPTHGSKTPNIDTMDGNYNSSFT